MALMAESRNGDISGGGGGGGGRGVTGKWRRRK